MLKQSGFSLVELMVSMAITLFLMLGITAFFSTSTRATADNIKTTRVNSVTRSAMELMSREITRAGYWHDSGQHIGASYANPFSTVEVAQHKQPGDCILFGYDANKNGTLDDTEFRGFRLNGSIIEMKTSGAAWQCDKGTWQVLTPGMITMDALRFTLTTQSVPADIKQVVSRKVQIQLSGSYKADRTVRQALDELVTIRNDIIL
jgi:prepilin peptidase dependent protein B